MKTSEVKIGDEGPLVQRIKAILRSQGAWNGTDSNQFGPKLKEAVQYFQSTHIGPDGDFLIIDGVVGDATWWALENPSGSLQKSGLEAVTPSGFYGNLVASRKNFLKKLFAEHALGVAEIPDGSNSGDGVDKYIQGYGPVFWCCLFQSWAWKEASGQWPLRERQAHVQTFWNSCMDRGMAFTKDKYSPVPGDMMVWKFSGGTGHISSVVSTSENGQVFNTIGGNEGNRVKLGIREIMSEPKCVGFINLHGDLAQSKKWTKRIFQTAQDSPFNNQNTR